MQHYIVVTLFLSVNQKLLSCFSNHFLGEIRRREREVAEALLEIKNLVTTVVPPSLIYASFSFSWRPDQNEQHAI